MSAGIRNWDYEDHASLDEATANLLLELAVDWACELISQHRGAAARRRLADGLEAAMRALGETA